MATGEPLTGAQVELDVGAPAHGGHCVARLDGPNGRVVFVRHALPGERVRAVVTEDHGSYCRADAVEVLTASPDRVPAPCPHAGPGRCGGCDWQHASADAQRELKAAVVREQFARVAKLDVSGLLPGVEPLPGGLLGWRTRITFAVDRAGRPGLHRHRSHEVEHMAACPLGVAGVGDTDALHRQWPGVTGVEAVRGDAPDVALLAHRPGRRGRQARGRRPPDVVEPVAGPETVTYRVGQREFTVDAGGFWQVHPAAAETFSTALLDALAPHPGESALDLFSGAGLLTAALADAVGPTGRVLGVESSAAAVANAATNLAATPWATVSCGRVDAALVGELAAQLGAGPDLVVLDPPRAGAGTDVMRALVALGPRAVGYVACDPAALARDVAAAAGAGWRLGALRAFDAFPMTHHVECVATLVPR
jgi:tRNA/tmRNA/rRNA uracil-C5-methylase (TrmA/RlmC/RlmD family)